MISKVHHVETGYCSQSQASLASHASRRGEWSPTNFQESIYIRGFIFYQHIKYHLLNMLKIKCNINQQYLKAVDLHIVKYE